MDVLDTFCIGKTMTCDLCFVPVAFKNSLVSDQYSNFWSHRDIFRPETWHFPFFSVGSKRPPIMITYDHKKIIAQMVQNSVFNGADPECWQIRTVYLRPANARIVTVICRKMLHIKFQHYADLPSLTHFAWDTRILKASHAHTQRKEVLTHFTNFI